MRNKKNLEFFLVFECYLSISVTIARNATLFYLQFLFRLI